MEAVGYVRVSTVEQTHGFGLEVQERAIVAHCADNGLELVETFRDEGKSGSNGIESRAGLASALALAESLQAALVVYRLDRLARTLVVQETTIGRARAAGCAIVSVTEADIDSDDPTRVLVRQVLGAISQYERALIRARLSAGIALKRAGGGYVGGKVPYGYRVVGDRLVPDPAEQQVVEAVRRLAAPPVPLPLRTIAAELDAAGVRSRTGSRWHPEQVRRILGAQGQLTSLAHESR